MACARSAGCWADHPGDRNQPAGTAELVRVDDIRRRLTAVQPDGRVVVADDPNKDIYGMLNARFVLKGDATVSPSGW